MPTIDVESSVSAPAFERRVARAIALWAHRQGIPASHMVVRFRPLDPSRTYSGPVPFSSLRAADGSAGRLAFVTCHVARDRDRMFRQNLANSIRDLMTPEVPAEFVFVAIQPVDPDDFFYRAQ